MDWGQRGGSAGGKLPVPMRRVGVKERYGQVGTQDFLQQEYGLTAEAIVEAAKSLL